MAALFDLGAEPEAAADGCSDGSDPVDAAFELIRDHISGLGPRPALRRIRRYQQKLAALETTVVASVTEKAGNDRSAKRMLDDGKTSRRSIARSAKRAAAAAKNKSLVDKMDKGELSSEQVDVIAETADKTDGAAATDEDFIAKVANTDPDQAKSIADKFIADHQTKDGVQSEHERQRTLRRTSRYTSKKSGLDVLALEGDGAAIANMFEQIKARADELFRADAAESACSLSSPLSTASNSTVRASPHPRTHAQRMFDAAYELLCGVTTTPTGCKPRPRHAADGGGTRSRVSIVVTLTLDQYLGIDRVAMAEQIGLGLIPDTVLADYLEHADMIGALFDRNGSPLWIARSKRDATLMQRYALIVRDKGCVLCGATHTSCQTHHLMPWNAPAKGETNIDELALLCHSCHRTLHNNNRTLFQDASRTWRTRPAAPHETPPNVWTGADARNRPQRE